MRKFQYGEIDDDGNDVLVTVTEEEIISIYGPYWEKQMVMVGKGMLISKERCIEDWVIINWAYEI